MLRRPLIDFCNKICQDLPWTRNAKTTFVRLHTDAICSIKFGVNPTASATTARMAAGRTEYHGVPLGQAYKVAVITNA